MMCCTKKTALLMFDFFHLAWLICLLVLAHVLSKVNLMYLGHLVNLLSNADEQTKLIGGRVCMLFLHTL